MNTKANLRQKRESAVLYLRQYTRNRDVASALHATRAVNVLAGAIELATLLDEHLAAKLQPLLQLTYDVNFYLVGTLSEFAAPEEINSRFVDVVKALAEMQNYDFFD